jgi:hypothetical protein
MPALTGVGLPLALAVPVAVRLALHPEPLKALRYFGDFLVGMPRPVRRGVVTATAAMAGVAQKS